jgi:hypothetical protein
MKNTSYFLVVDLDNNWYKTEACQSPDHRRSLKYTPSFCSCIGKIIQFASPLYPLNL